MKTEKVMKQTRWILWALCLMMVGCATQKETHQHTTHVIEADTLAKEAQHDSHVQQTAQQIDSIVTASVWAAMQEWSSSQMEHEVTTETLTETIDSLGRIIRQSQKTTDKTLSKQELQRQTEQLQQISTDLHRHIEQLDSAWSSRFSTMETHLRDSLSAQLDKVSNTSAAPAATWWQKTWSWLKGILIGIAIGIVIMLTKKWWMKLII